MNRRSRLLATLAVAGLSAVALAGVADSERRRLPSRRTAAPTRVGVAETPPPFAWVRTLSGSETSRLERAADVETDHQGNVVATGAVESLTGGTELVVVKYAPSGAELWSRTISASGGSAAGADVEVGRDGSVFVAGYVSDPATGEDLLVAKWAPDGTPVWAKTLPDRGGNDRALSLTLDAVENPVAAGYSTDGRGVQSFTVVKFSGREGDLGWRRFISSRTVGNFAFDVAGAGTVTGGGDQEDIVAVGTLMTEGGSSFYVLKLQGSTGEDLWDYSDAGGTGDVTTRANSVVVDSQGRVVVGGTLFTAGASQFYVLQLAADGNFVWSSQPDAGTGDHAEVLDVAVDSTDAVVAAGFHKGSSDSDIRIDKLLAADGTRSFTKRIRGSETEAPDNQGNAVFIGPGDRIYVAGRFHNAGSGFDFALLELAPNGDLLPPTILNGSLTGSVPQDEALAVSVDPFGNAALAGVTQNASSGYDFTVAYVDRQAPLIPSCSLDPTVLGPAGGTVTVTLEAKDNVDVAKAEAIVHLPAGDERVTLARATGDTFSGTFTAPANSGPVEMTIGVEVEVADAAGNTSRAGCGDVRVQRDATPPSLSNCSVTPRSLPASGGDVVIRADATDDVGVTRVQAKVTRPDLTVETILLARTSGDTFEATYTAAANSGSTAATYSVEIGAEDGALNLATEPCGTFEVAAGDAQPPVITEANLMPRSMPSGGGPVLISARITDNVGVASAKAVITLPDSSTAEAALTLDTGAMVYRGTYAAPANTARDAKTYSVEIQAADAQGNVGRSAAGGFTVEGADLDPPVIESGTLDPVALSEEGGTVTIRAIITDNVGVVGPKAHVTLPDETTATVTLTAGANDVYTGTYTAGANTTEETLTYGVEVLAQDAAGNVSRRSLGAFTVGAADRTPPQIHFCDASPRQLLASGGRVRIQASVTDSEALNRVEAVITSPDGSTETIELGDPNPRIRGKRGPLGQGLQITHVGDFDAPANEGAETARYEVVIRATDASGNVATQDCGEFVVTDLPRISDCTVDPRELPATGGTVRISARILDSEGLERVVARLVPGGVRKTGKGKGDGTITVTLSPEKGGELYHGSVTLAGNKTGSLRGYRVTIEAVDAAGNRAAEPCGEIVFRGAGRLVVTPTRVEFGNIRVTYYAEKRITLKNTGQGELNGTIGPVEAPFTLYVGKEKVLAQGVSGVPYTLAPGESLQVTIRFIPPRRRTFSESLVIRSSDPRRSSVDVSVRGTGCGTRPSSGKK
ncbi:MAG: hypothetical protein ACK47B_19550 [Armatimonadota bacterium]